MSFAGMLILDQITWMIQGISYWNIFYELTMTDRNTWARFYLKVVLKFQGLDIWVSSTSFQKSNIGWPQQPPTEIGPKIQHDISWFYHFFSFQNIKIKLNSGTCMAMKSSLVIFQALKPLWPQCALMASTASTTSGASMTFIASFHQKKYCSWWLDTPWQPNHQLLSF